MNEVVADCIKYCWNVGIVAGCLLALGILAVRQGRPKVTRRRPLTLGEALLQKHNRKGISLIEVLMSIFIISIGILGVLSLVYLGGHQTQSGLDADLAASAGRQAMHDFKVRGCNSPSMWRTPSGATVSSSGSGSLDVMVSLTPFQQNGPQKYFLDPRGVARGITAPFPAVSGASQTMPRISMCPTLFTPQPPPPAPPIPPSLYLATMGTPQADEAFSLQDDLHFTVVENDPTAAPIQTMENGEKRFTKRDYSWFATIVRDQAYGHNYTVSVAVVRSRHTPAAADEFDVACEFLGGGVNGGEVKLTGDATSGPAIAALRAGQWLLLTHAERVLWYRIGGSDEYLPATYSRVLTLIGGDWIPSGPYATPRAVIVPGVVGVYTRDMLLKNAVY